MKGWVYIITNKSMPNLLNIGFSNNDPALKAEELNKSEIPHPYVVEYDALLNEPKETAQKIQAILSHCHENKGWFRCEVAKAIIAIRQAAADSIIVENNRNAEVKKPETRKAEPEQKKPEPEKVAAKSLDIQDLYAAVIGEKNCDYYLAKFKKFDEQKAGLKISWNGAAFLFNSLWSLYRKMYGWFFTLSGIGIFFSFLGKVAPDVSFFVFIPMIIFGMFADSLYHEKVKHKIAKAQLTIKNEAELFEFLRDKGGISFSGRVAWIFLAVPVIGIVASIAIPAFQDYKTRQAATANITTNSQLLVSAEPAQNVPQEVIAPEKATVANQDVVAIVNDTAISKAAFKSLEDEISTRSPEKKFPKKQLLEELIQRELLVQEAQKEHLEQSSEIKERIDMASRSLLSQADLQSYLKANPITDADLKSGYDKEIAKMTGTEYKASHILVKTEEEANRLITELNKGAKFENLAKNYSLDPSKDQGGNLGWFTAGQMVESFSKAVDRLEKGRFTQVPVQTQFGWHVILREDSREQVAPAFDTVKEQLRPMLQQQKVQAMLQGLRKQARVEIFMSLEESKKDDKTDPVAIVNDTAISRATFKTLENEIATRAQGQKFPKGQLLEELIQRELLVQDAKNKHLDQSAELKESVQMAERSLLLQAYLQKYLKENPVTDAELRAAYDKEIAKMSDSQVPPVFNEIKEKLRPMLQQQKTQAMLEELRKHAKVEILMPMTE